MAIRTAASALLLLLAVAGVTHAQLLPPMQPFTVPEGAQVATASAVSNGPGSSSSFSSNNNGVTSGYTQSTGRGDIVRAESANGNSVGTADVVDVFN